KEMTRKVSAEVDLVHQQTQNQRYGSSHIGATAKDISNVVTDAASGVVDIFHGIDKAVADTWNNFWKDGKADGIGSNLSRKDRKSGSAGMPRPISYAVFCLKKKKHTCRSCHSTLARRASVAGTPRIPVNATPSTP